MKSISDKNIEEWMFDYTEGNLSATQQKQLIRFIEQNPHYAEELNVWTMAFIKAPLPEVNLEKFSLKPGVSIRYFKAWSYGVIALGIVTATMLYLWYGYPKEKMASRKENKNSLVKTSDRIICDAQIYNAAKSTLPKEVGALKIMKKTPAKVGYATSLEMGVKNEKPAEVLLPLLNPDTVISLKKDTIIITLNDSLSPKPLELISEPENSHEVKHRILSKKELKDIERMKMKALQRRREAEFMKGNKPYVVPFNNGF